NVEGLFRMEPEKPFERRPNIYDEDSDSEDDDDREYRACCPFHRFRQWDPWRDEDVLENYTDCRNWTKKQLLGTPLVILGQQVLLNEDSVKVAGDKILFHR